MDLDFVLSIINGLQACETQLQQSNTKLTQHATSLEEADSKLTQLEADLKESRSKLSKLSQHTGDLALSRAEHQELLNNSIATLNRTTKEAVAIMTSISKLMSEAFDEQDLKLEEKEAAGAVKRQPEETENYDAGAAAESRTTSPASSATLIASEPSSPTFTL